MKEPIISLSIVTINRAHKLIAILDSGGTCWKFMFNTDEGSKLEEISEIKSYVKFSSMVGFDNLFYLIDFDGFVWRFDNNESDLLQKYENLSNVKNIFICRINYAFILFKNGKILLKKFWAYNLSSTNFLDISGFTELCSMSRVISIEISKTDIGLFLLDDGVVFAYNIVKKTYSFVANNIQKIGFKCYLDNNGQLFGRSNKRMDSQHDIIDFGGCGFACTANFELLHLTYNEKLQLVASDLPQLLYIPNKSARK